MIADDLYKIERGKCKIKKERHFPTSLKSNIRNFGDHLKFFGQSY